MNFISIDARQALAELDDPRAPIPIKRTVAADLVAALIDYLDDMDGDADLEPSLAGFDGHAYHDGEADLEGDGLDEGELDTADDEPSLGWNTSEASFGCRPTFDPDREDEHDGAEPENEHGASWPEGGSQIGYLFAGFTSNEDDEDDADNERDVTDGLENDGIWMGERDEAEYDYPGFIRGGGSGPL
jgi:hypothetical protein